MSKETLGLLLVAAQFGGFLLFFILMGMHARKRLRELSDDPPLDLVTTKPNRTFPKPLVRASAKVARDELVPSDDPPLQIGDECTLVGGVGPVMTVVDGNHTDIVASWDDGQQEHNFSREAVRRYRPDELVRPRKPVTA
jgi:hypothetical protein